MLFLIKIEKNSFNLINMRSFSEFAQNYKHSDIYSYNNMTLEELFENYGSDLDKAIHKTKVYSYNTTFRNDYINEHYSNYNVYYTPNESLAITCVLEHICQDYLNELLIEEGKLTDTLKNLWDTAKQKTSETLSAIKTKIKEVTELLKDLANKTIKTVKDMAGRLLKLLDKSDCTIEELLKKAGFNTDKLKESWFKDAEDLGKEDNLKEIQNNNLYESYGNYIKTGNEEYITEQHILEFSLFGKKKKEETTGEVGSGDKVIKSGEKKGIKEMLWSAFKQLAIWATVCVIIPGTVVAFFPGTFIALIVPLVCKLGWNCYKIPKLYKQFKNVKDGWSSMKKWQKVLSIFSIAASLVGLIFNFSKIIGDSGKVMEAFVKCGGNLAAKAQIGVSPDMMTTGFAAVVKSIKEGKFSWEDIKSAYEEINKSFAEHITITTETIKNVGNGAMNDQNIEAAKDCLKETMKGEKATTFVQRLQDKWDTIKNSLPSGYKYFADNIKFPGGVDKVLKSPEGQEWLAKYGKYLTRIPFKSSNEYGTTWSALYAFPEGSAKADEAMNALLTIMKNTAGNGVLGELGTTAAEVVSTTSEILGAVSAMAMSVPIINIVPKNDGGFRVRLGSKDEKDNYIYEVGPEGVKEQDYSKVSSDIKKVNEEAVNKLSELHKNVKNELSEYKEKLNKDEDIDDEKKKKALKAIEETEKSLGDDLNSQRVVVFYGKRYKEENTNESISLSLADYIINESGSTTPEELKKEVQEMFARLNSALLSYQLYDFDKPKNEEKVNKEEDKEDIKKSIEKLKKRYNEKNIDNIIKDLIDKKLIKLVNNNGTIQIDYEKNPIHPIKDIKPLWRVLKALTDSDANVEIKNIENITKNYEKKSQEKIDNLTPEKQQKLLQLPNISDSKPNSSDIPAEAKKYEIATSTSNETDNNNNDEGTEPDETSTNNNDEQPVLFFSPLFMLGADLAKATKNGPRKDTYSFKGLYESLEFITFEGSSSKGDIEKMLVSIANNSLTHTINSVSDVPCIKEEDSDKYVVNDKSKYEESDERENDFGKFTNSEITEIMNENDKMKDYFGKSGGKITSLADSEDEKKELEKIEKENKEVLQNNDNVKEKIQNSESLTSVLDDDGNIDDKELEKLNRSLSEYEFGQRKAKKKKSFWSKIKSFFGFGDDEKVDDKAKDQNGFLIKELIELLKEIKSKRSAEKQPKESLQEYIRTSTVFETHRSLKDYIKNN